MVQASLEPWAAIFRVRDEFAKEFRSNAKRSDDLAPEKVLEPMQINGAMGCGNLYLRQGTGD